MRVRDAHPWFYFKFDHRDYREHSMRTLNEFIDEVKRVVPQEARNYFDDESEWQIAQEYRPVFNGLVNRFFNRAQASLF